jgi:hypothetical protein
MLNDDFFESDARVATFHGVAGSAGASASDFDKIKAPGLEGVNITSSLAELSLATHPRLTPTRLA